MLITNTKLQQTPDLIAQIISLLISIICDKWHFCPTGISHKNKKTQVMCWPIRAWIDRE